MTPPCLPRCSPANRSISRPSAPPTASIPARPRTLTEASQLEGTDIFYITYHSPLSEDDAVNFSGIWAEEINAYTKRLQQTEARDVRAILEKEVVELEKQIDSTNLEILNFSKENDFLGGDSQVAAVLGKLSQIELELEAARTSVAAKKQQLENLTEQISHQSPIELQIKTAREELANLRSTYTDENPLVQTKLQSMEYLEEQIAKLKEGRQGGARRLHRHAARQPALSNHHRPAQRTAGGGKPHRVPRKTPSIHRRTAHRVSRDHQWLRSASEET